MNDPVTQTALSGSQDRNPQGYAAKVLIVEDSADFVEILRVTLRRLDVRVFTAGYGSRAVEVFRREQPDLVLMDVALPDATGWQVLDLFRACRRDGRDPIVIMMTAYGDVTNRLMGRLHGVHSYLVKPFPTERIAEPVAEALGVPFH